MLTRWVSPALAVTFCALAVSHAFSELNDRPKMLDDRAMLLRGKQSGVKYSCPAGCSDSPSTVCVGCDKCVSTCAGNDLKKCGEKITNAYPRRYCNQDPAGDRTKCVNKPSATCYTFIECICDVTCKSMGTEQNGGRQHIYSDDCPN